MRIGTLKELLRNCRNVFVICLLLSAASAADAQLLYSFESDLQGWAGTGFTGSDFISVAQSTEGATQGTRSMAIETGVLPPDTGFGWDVGRTVTPTSLPDVYSAFNAAAADPSKYSLEFDVSITPSSFANVSATGPFFLINVSVNSSDGAGGGGFDQIFNVTPNLIGTDTMGNWVPNIGTYHVTIPFSDTLDDGGSLHIAPNSSFYQLNIGSNKNSSLFMNGPQGQGAVYFVDNIRIVEEPDTVAEALFSWETPDDPSTPGVNEQFEGWQQGFHAGHAHSITSTGATHGSSALQIDRTSVATGFSWGSQFILNSDINPDPQVEQIDPVIQARIDELTDKITNAQSVAFDVTYQYVDRFPLPDPTFTRFGVHFSDETGVFYQSEQQGFINVVSAMEPTTVTIEIPLTLFNTPSGDKNLLRDGFVEGTSFFRIGLSTNTNGAQVYQIDNFRLISLATTGLAGDYNEDGKVDAADYVLWRKNDGSPDGYNAWRANFGMTAPSGAGVQSAVPEPSSVLLLASVFASAVFIAGAQRRRNTA